MSHPYGSPSEGGSGHQPPAAPTYGAPTANDAGHGQQHVGQGASHEQQNVHGVPHQQTPAYGQRPGDPNVPPTTPPKKRWPLWVGIGCGCLLLLALAAIALAFGLNAMKDAKPDTDTPTATTTSASASASPSESASASASGSASPSTAALGTITQEDQEAVKQRYFAFMTAVDSNDYAGACRLMLDPETHKPMTEDRVNVCVTGLQSEPNQETGQLTGFTADVVQTTPNPDGTVSASVGGQAMPYPAKKADDGQWYIEVNG